MNIEEGQPHQYAIVAEYRGVAILERRGDKRAVWQGQEYFTDGRSYVAWRHDNRMGSFAFADERDTKSFIDAIKDFPETIPEEYKRVLMNYREMYQTLMRKSLRGEVPQYVFDETAGVFIMMNGVRDGQHRHKGLK